MNFLGIKQVIVIIFTLKINFHIYLSNFLAPWTARIKSDKCRGRYIKFPKTQTNSGLDRGLDSRKIRVSYVKPVGRRGIRPRESSDQNTMSTFRSSRYYNGTRHWPLDPDPTVDIHLTPPILPARSNLDGSDQLYAIPNHIICGDRRIQNQRMKNDPAPIQPKPTITESTS
jgi:hypothetical protein